MDENKNTTENIGETAKENAVEFTSQFLFYLISNIFVMWGWNILAPHINAPQFTYWEMFAMRMGLNYVMKTLWQK